MSDMTEPPWCENENSRLTLVLGLGLFTRAPLAKWKPGDGVKRGKQSDVSQDVPPLVFRQTISPTMHRRKYGSKRNDVH
jgi:hypothetical protein